MSENIQQRVAAALGSKSLSAADCKALLLEVQQRDGVVNMRLEAIKPAKSSIGTAGPDRLKVLATGSALDVQRLDDEYQALAIEAEQLRAQRGELARRRQEAVVREAVEGAADRYRDFARKLEAAADARQAFEAALKAVDAVYGEIEQTRYTANAARAVLPAAPPGLLTQVEALRPWSGQVKTRLWTRNSSPAEILGLPQ